MPVLLPPRGVGSGVEDEDPDRKDEPASSSNTRGSVDKSGLVHGAILILQP